MDSIGFSRLQDASMLHHVYYTQNPLRSLLSLNTLEFELYGALQNEMRMRMSQRSKHRPKPDVESGEYHKSDLVQKLYLVVLNQ